MGEPAAVYGEPLYGEAIAAQLELALLDAPQDWLPGLPEEHRKRDIRVSTLGEARQWETPVFVKPADGRKGFEGAVYEGGDGLPPVAALPDTTAVLMAEPVRWELEVRCFVRDGELVTLSPYARFGELAQARDDSWPISAAEEAAARKYLERLLSDVPVAPSVVLDIGLIEGRGWAVVESNSAWGAGVYGCDPAGILEVLERGCVPRAQLDPFDAVWAVDRVRIAG